MQWHLEIPLMEEDVKEERKIRERGQRWWEEEGFRRIPWKKFKLGTYETDDNVFLLRGSKDWVFGLAGGDGGAKIKIGVAYLIRIFSKYCTEHYD